MRPITALEQGRRSYAAEAWLNAFEALGRADREEALAAEDLGLLATSAYMLGRDDEYVEALERAHQIHMERGDLAHAVRCAFWIGHSFLFRGEKVRSSGWFARLQRLLEGFDDPCVERGYALIPVWLQQMGRGDFEGGLATALEAARVGERFRDADLVWLARDDQARALLRMGRGEEGLRLVDEALVAAASGELSPIVTGIVYCNTIAFCRAAYEVRRVREWTVALTGWCERQPEMVAHNGLCLVHRAEVLLMGGEWERALEEARRSAERFGRGALNRLAAGRAHYCQGEAHRLGGRLPEAEEAYKKASERGFEPQPGLALLRLAEGKSEAAAASIRRVVGETTAPLARAGLLPAYVEVMLAVGSVDLAHAGSRELDEIAERFGAEVLRAMAAQLRGVLDLVDGRHAQALVGLRHAASIWNELSAPYDVARVRELLGVACRALGDEDHALLELEAAGRAFGELGAATDLARVEARTRKELPGRAVEARGLTRRELQVLRLIAAARSNREIASELFISEHTVARHVQNIFAKLSVSSRTAAAAFAFEHDLVQGALRPDGHS